MSELGKCPTCGGKVSTAAVVCPHCGERDFTKARTGSKKIVCIECRGNGSSMDWVARMVGEKCSICSGTGEVTPKEEIDLRTGKLRLHSPSLEQQYQHDPIQREEIRREGCLNGVFGLVVAAVVVFWIGRTIGFW